MNHRASGAKSELIAQSDAPTRASRRRTIKRMCSWAWDWEWCRTRRAWKNYRDTQYKVTPGGG